MAIRFKVSDADARFLRVILRRAAHIARQNLAEFDRLEYGMSLRACHANGCPMDFERLSAADDFNLMHDVIGIDRHVSRVTGKLENHFFPRFAAKTPTGRTPSGPEMQRLKPSTKARGDG